MSVSELNRDMSRCELLRRSVNEGEKPTNWAWLAPSFVEKLRKIRKKGGRQSFFQKLRFNQLKPI